LRGTRYGINQSMSYEVAVSPWTEEISLAGASECFFVVVCVVIRRRSCHTCKRGGGTGQHLPSSRNQRTAQRHIQATEDGPRVSGCAPRRKTRSIHGTNADFVAQHVMAPAGVRMQEKEEKRNVQPWSSGEEREGVQLEGIWESYMMAQSACCSFFFSCGCAVGFCPGSCTSSSAGSPPFWPDTVL
jgi:hypothetical protein